MRTCVGDAVVLAPPAHVIYDDDPDQRGADHAAHHHDHHDADGGPAILVVADAGVAVGRWRDGQVDVATLCAQRVRHDACVFASVSRASVHNDQQLVGGGKEVALSEHQLAVVLGPVKPGGGAPPGDALQHGGFATCH